MAFGTAHLALTERARLQAGQVLLVLGAGGGVGVAAVQVHSRAACDVERLDIAAAYGLPYLQAVPAPGWMHAACQPLAGSRCNTVVALHADRQAAGCQGGGGCARQREVRAAVAAGRRPGR